MHHGVWVGESGVALVRDDPAASAGSSYVTFDSDLDCVFPGGPEGDDARFGFWLDAPVPAEPAHLYFDALSLDDETPSGIVRIDTLGLPSGCASDESLATVDLAALAVTNEWQTPFVRTCPIMSGRSAPSKRRSGRVYPSDANPCPIRPPPGVDIHGTCLAVERAVSNLRKNQK